MKELYQYENYYDYLSQESGMSKKDIKNHLKNFKKGGSFLVAKDTYEGIILGKPWIGFREDQTNFILSKIDMDDLIRNSNNNISYIEEKLGMNRNTYSKGFYRIDVIDPFKHDIRMATGTERGANKNYNTSPRNESRKAENNDIPTPDRPYKYINVLDLSDDSPRPKGEYYVRRTGQPNIRSNYAYNQPDVRGYNGLTSGGFKEAVVGLIANTAQNVKHSKFISDGNNSFTMDPSFENAYYNPNNIPNSGERIVINKDQLKILSKFKDTLNLEYEPFPSNNNGEERFTIVCTNDQIGKIDSIVNGDSIREITGIEHERMKSLEKLDLMIRKNRLSEKQFFCIKDDKTIMYHKDYETQINVLLNRINVNNQFANVNRRMNLR